jgi:hypothetical protein
MTATYLQMQAITASNSANLASPFSSKNLVFAVVAMIVIVGVVLFLDRQK